MTAHTVLDKVLMLRPTMPDANSIDDEMVGGGKLDSKVQVGCLCIWDERESGVSLVERDVRGLGPGVSMQAYPAHNLCVGQEQRTKVKNWGGVCVYM